MLSAVPRELPNSNLLAGLAWAKRGEEEARAYAELRRRQVDSRDSRLRTALRRTRRGVQNILRAIERDNLREVPLPEGTVEIMELIVYLCETMRRELVTATLSDVTRDELRALEDVVVELDDFVEDERLAAEVPALFAQVAARATELYGAPDESSE